MPWSHLHAGRSAFRRAGCRTGSTGIRWSRVQEANARQGEIYDKSNFLSEMQNTLEDCLKNGLMDTYMRYIKEVGIYSAMTGRSA